MGEYKVGQQFVNKGSMGAGAHGQVILCGDIHTNAEFVQKVRTIVWFLLKLIDEFKLYFQNKIAKKTSSMNYLNILLKSYLLYM